jgi:hypothetical protein
MSTATGKDIANTGLCLLDVVPIVFPEHLLMKELQRQREEIRVQMMTRFWRDNGPWALLRAMKLCNANHHTCNCPACITAKSPVRISCRLWDRLTWFMTSSGLTYCVICVCPTDSWEVGAEGPTNLTSIQNSVQANPYPPPDGFNSLTACKYLAPVSHIDVHIVFQRAGNVLGITYGRRLWEDDSLSGPEIRKLDMLFSRLHV